MKWPRGKTALQKPSNGRMQDLPSAERKSRDQDMKLSIITIKINQRFIMEHPATIRDILYGICNTRDANLPLFQRELKAYLLRRGVMYQREPHDPPAKPP